MCHTGCAGASLNEGVAAADDEGDMAPSRWTGEVDVECPNSGRLFLSALNTDATAPTATAADVSRPEDAGRDTPLPLISPPIVRLSCTLLGRGRQGSVWLAEDAGRHGLFYAVKIVEVPIGESLPVHKVIEMLGDPSACTANMSSAICAKKRDLEAAFEEEARLWQGLSHPGLLRLHGVNTSAGNGRSAICHFYAEYMSCGSLLSFVRSHYKAGRLCEQALRWFLKPVLQGLCYMHARNVVHQDIKAENIFVKWTECHENNSGTHVSTLRRFPVAKLGDFGCARCLETDCTSDNTTTFAANVPGSRGGRASARRHSEMPCGTLGFMAPEMILHLHDACDACSPAADVWSFGCTILQLLRGSLPVRQEAGFAAILFETAMHPKRIQRFIPPLAGSDAHDGGVFVSPSLRDLLLRCLQPNPRKRATAAQLLRHPFFLRDCVPDDSAAGALAPALFRWGDESHAAGDEGGADHALKSTGSALSDGVLSSDGDNDDYPEDDVTLRDHPYVFC